MEVMSRAVAGCSEEDRWKDTRKKEEWRRAYCMGPGLELWACNWIGAVEVKSRGSTDAYKRSQTSRR